MASPFLTAAWRRLLLMTYAVPPEVLEKRLPEGIEPDLLEGSAYVSLVAFDFLKTRVWGVPWPGYQNFPEINLRYYVRRGDQRGVMFVRELVPKWITTTIARLLYNEPYSATSMRSKTKRMNGELRVAHRFLWKGEKYSFDVRAKDQLESHSEDSLEHHFKEHEWGFGVTRGGRVLRYRVVHPEWQTYPVVQASHDINWEHLYGQEWSFLQDQKPFHVMLAEGSPIEVYPAEKL